jgi:hypothetical protein
VKSRAVVATALAAALLGACGYANPYPHSGSVAGLQTPTPTPTATPGPPDDFKAGSGTKPRMLPNGLEVIDLTVGTGATAQSGQSLTVQYTGWLSNGKKFDSSRDRNQPFTFTVGKQQVIKGWDEGVPGMKVGGKRKLIIPPALGYGAKGAPPTIPPNAELVFEIELLAIGGSASPKP